MSQTTVPNQYHEQAKKDFYKALFMDLFFIAALVAVYFINRGNGFLDRLISKF